MTRRSHSRTVPGAELTTAHPGANVRRPAVDALVAVLTRVSADRSRTIAYYGNARPRPGRSPRAAHIISDTGFLVDAVYSLLAPNPSHVTRGTGDRACTSITLHSYGGAADIDAILRTRRTVAGPEAGAVMSAECNDATYAPAKTQRLIEQITGDTGPAYHFVVTRRGDVLVCALLDDTVVASPAADRATTIDIAVETAFAAPAVSWEAGNVSQIDEMPYTDAQLDTLAVLIAKLLVAYPSITLETMRHIQPALPSPARHWNFSANAWNADGASPFDHTRSDLPGFANVVMGQRDFDLATEVFEVPASSGPVAGRAEAISAVDSVDTLSARSVVLGAYAEIAGLERSHAMQATTRRQFFVQRIGQAHQQVHTAAATAQQVATTGVAAPDQSVGNTDPYRYDYATGIWLDNSKTY